MQTLYNKCLNLIAEKWLSCFMLLVLIITCTNYWGLGAGVLWNTAHGLGYAAFICLLYTCFSKPAKLNIVSHRSLGYLTLLFASLHVLVLLITDPITIEYLKPSAPLYMWLGSFSAIFIVCIIVSSLTRFKNLFYNSSTTFKTTHKIMSWLIIAGSLVHIIDSGFYIYQYWQIFAIILVAIFSLWSIPIKRFSPINSFQVTLQLIVFMAFFIGFWGLSS